MQTDVFKMNELIEINNLGKVFETSSGNIAALSDITLSIRDGEIFGIIGLSGAGKSTLVRCINFLEQPTCGTVVFDGKELNSLSEKELRLVRRRMGMIFQQFNLLAQRTALGNVTFPLEISGVSRETAAEKAMSLLHVVGLADRASSYPSQLSGGQKQRVAIARALACDPKVLLCDEATSALDPTTTRQILDLIAKINREMGITVVIITHEMKVIEQICDRVAIIDHSRIAELGDVSEIFTRPKSDIARQLIFPGGRLPDNFEGSSRIRIIFDGKSSFEPVIANMVLECSVPVNILFADTRDIGGKAVGQMVLQLPEAEQDRNRILAWLDMKRVNWNYEEEGGETAV